jgi:hypothetical protein
VRCWSLNVVPEPRRVEWSGEAEQLLSTHLDGEGTVRDGPFLLRADEGVILKVRRRGS